MKCKKKISLLFSSKFFFLRLQHFFLSNTYPVNSSVVQVYKVHVFDEAFFPLSNDCYDVITDQRLFFSMGLIVRQKIPS